jgi:hypothetical protein
MGTSLWRQGDVFLAAVAAIPAEADRLKHGTLVEGEVTGHRHRVEDLTTAQVFQSRRELYLRVVGDDARIIHDDWVVVDDPPPRARFRAWPRAKPRFVARPVGGASAPGAGGGSIRMIGSPGTGKSMLAAPLPTILPPQTPAEGLETTRIYSATRRPPARSAWPTTACCSSMSCRSSRAAAWSRCSPS